jgi:hypothetical protein
MFVIIEVLIIFVKRVVGQVDEVVMHIFLAVFLGG